MCLKRLNRIFAICLSLGCFLFMDSVAHSADVELDRPGLVYCIGRIEQVHKGSALIDLGDAQTLTADESVAVVRPTNGHYTPLGVIRIAETYPTFCRAYRSTYFEPKIGDVVMFVRQFSDLKPGGQHSIEFTKQQMIKKSGQNAYSTRRRTDVARALYDYEKNQPGWGRSRSDVVGYLNGASFAEGGEKQLKPLLNQLDMLRRHYRVGRNSLPAAGSAWVSVMSVLFGRTVVAQHESAQKIVVEDEQQFADEEKGPAIRDVQRAVRDELFDRSQEEQNLFSFIVATALEQSPKKFDLWLQQQVEQSQFPELADEDVVLDVVKAIVRKLREI